MACIYNIYDDFDDIDKDDVDDYIFDEYNYKDSSDR